MKDNFKDALNDENDKQKMDHFWTYFFKYWLSSDEFINAWNINNYVGNKNTLKRTNNGLERYNKTMKSLFRSGAPSFAEFVNMMREESEAQQKKVEGYMNKAIVKRKKIDENDGNFIYDVPACYVNWEPPSPIKN